MWKMVVSQGQVTLFASFGTGLEEVRVKEVRARLAIKIATAAISEAQGNGHTLLMDNVNQKEALVILERTIAFL
jgi:hypothetical protein